jgi:hypothetical protein
VRVIAPTLVAVDENTFVIGFVAKTSGAASTVQPGKTPERLSGSEAVGGNVKLTRQPDGKWKGKIEQTKLNWGKYCYQDLSLWLSRELERRLEYALPEVQIDGLRLFAEKTLTVHNATKSDLTVSLQLRTKVTAPKPVVKGLKVSLPKEWKWLPGDPDDDTAYQFKLKAGESKRVTGKMTGRTTDDPVTASRVQIWAEADDGEDWTTHYDQDFWLVPENPKKNNDREYQAEKAADARYTFHPKSGFRTYDERVIGFTNATAKPVRVSLDFRSSEDGKTTWRKLPEFEVPAGETVRPRDKAGQLVRASAVKFVAVSEQFGYREFQDKPLWVVAETDGLRLYKAEKVGTYTHTLKAVEAIKPGGDK